MLRLRAQQVVGIIVADKTSLEILPKIDGDSSDASARRSLVHMLAAVLDLEIADGAFAQLSWQKEDLLEILIRLFCDKLIAAIRRGMPRSYVDHEEDLTALRGRLDVKRQFTRLATSPQKIACRYESLSPDVALNRIMKAAIARLLSISRSLPNQRKLIELAFAYDEIHLVAVRELPWSKVVIDRTNSGWSELLRFARLFLSDRFQTTSSGDTAGFSLLFEMNTLFEEFIGRTVRRTLSGTDVEVSLQGPRGYALIDHISDARRFATRPDIVLSRRGRNLLVVDTKWKRLKGEIDDAKRGVGQADVYQMMAYSHVYKCENLMLLYPHHAEMVDAKGRVSLHRISEKPESRFTVATVCLSDPKTVASQLKALVDDAISRHSDVYHAARTLG